VPKKKAVPKTTPLTAKQKDEIIAIIAVGCSRKTAASYVGTTPAFIRKTAQKDAKFAEALQHADVQAEISSMKNVTAAARQERYWKAATWILERKNPEDYRLRPPGTFTPEQLQFIVTRLSEIITEEISAPTHRKRLLARLDGFLKEMK
ncbi:MAG: hypothetical protein Q4C70_14460, partial [Planctomycetia bacterium]|nr:hypothetical protein [Planctomycetia bacterium]